MAGHGIIALVESERTRSMSPKPSHVRPAWAGQGRGQGLRDSAAPGNPPRSDLGWVDGRPKCSAAASLTERVRVKGFG